MNSTSHSSNSIRSRPALPPCHPPATRPPSVDYQVAELPALQPQVNMPDAATAPAHAATDVPYIVDLDAITVPAKPA